MNELTGLEHVTVEIMGGAKIVVLNTGALIGPEAEAMLQALHSRSVGGISSHLKVLATKGAENFMSQYYIGYGHKSIGDCGTCTIFIEGVSMLVAKAIQDWRLYSGQEASTRFIDFASQKFIDPAQTLTSHHILESWRSFYLKGIDELQESLKFRYPNNGKEKESDYKKAIAARSFDIMRGFLPAGASTNLAWHSNLRQIADHLMMLRHHPLMEVRDVAAAIDQALSEAFPSSFKEVKLYAETEEYNAFLMNTGYLYTEKECPEFVLENDDVDRNILGEYRELLVRRPAKTELPKHLAEAGTLRFRYLLDFGSFRDLQRHRAVIQRMPLVVTTHGFEEWYLSELTDELRMEAEVLLRKQREAVQQLGVSPEVEQYYTAMGYKLPNRLTGDLHALTYLVELRGTRFVHPTARRRALQMAAEMKQLFEPHGLILHMDKEPDRFDAKRGSHDIVAKD